MSRPDVVKKFWELAKERNLFVSWKFSFVDLRPLDLIRNNH